MKGREIKIARIKAGMRQADLARRLGVTENYLCKIETGVCRPGRALLQKIRERTQPQSRPKGKEMSLTSQRLLTPHEVAEYLKIPVRSVRRLARNGKLKVIYIGRLMRFDPSDLKETT